MQPLPLVAAAALSLTLLTPFARPVHAEVIIPKTEAGRPPERQPPRDPYDVTIQLDRTLPEVRFEGQAMVDIDDVLADVTGANIVVNRPALRRAGVSENAPINLSLQNVPMSDALRAMLEQASTDAARIDFAHDGELIYVSTVDDLARLAAIRERAAAREPETPWAKALFKARLVVRPEHRHFCGEGEAFPCALDFDGPLAEVLDALSDLAGVPVRADWDQLRAAGVDPQAPVSLYLNDVTLPTALTIALWLGSPDVELDFEIRDDEIRILLPAPVPDLPAEGKLNGDGRERGRRGASRGEP